MKIIIAVVTGFLIVMVLAFLSDKFRTIKNGIWDRFIEPVGMGFATMIATIIIFIPLSFVSAPFVYSDGIKTGSITKFTNKGLIFKTWEGQLNLGGMVSNGDGGMVANVWNFSVTDKELIIKLQNSEGRISLYYDELLLVPIHVGSTNYIVKEVK